MSKSPSKYTSLKRLKAAKALQDTSESRNYAPCELDALIAEKENQEAMRLVVEAQAKMYEMAKTAKINDLISGKAFKPKTASGKVIRFPLDMNKECNW